MRFATLLLGVGHLAVFYQGSKAFGQDSNTTEVQNQTESAVLPTSAERFLLETIDLTVKPCDNFYKFVCGNIKGDEALEQAKTIKWNGLNDELSKHSSEFTLRPIQTAIIATQNLWSKNATDKDAESLMKAIVHEFFHVSGISPRIFADDYDNEPNAEQLGKAIGYLASRRLFPLFNLGKTVSNSSLPEKKPYMVAIWPAKQNVTESLFTTTLVVKGVIDYFGLPAPSDLTRIEQISKRLKQLKTFLDESQSAAGSGKNEIHFPDDLNMNFIDWTALLLESGRNIDKNQNWRNRILRPLIKFYDMDFFMNLRAAFDNQQIDGKLLAQFLVVEMLKDIPANYLVKLPEKTIPPGLKLAYGRIYVDAAFSNPMKRRRLQANVDQLTSNVMEAWKEIINESMWMSTKSRQKAYMKLDNMKTNLLFPNEIMNDTFLFNYYKNLDISPDDSFVKTMEKLRIFSVARELADIFETTSFPLASYSDVRLIGVLSTNAWHTYAYNSITIPLAIAQSPIYDPEWSARHAYGGLGYIIGHEIGHGFDINGINYNELGQIDSILDADSMKAFNNYAQCLISEYGTMCTTMSDANLECIDGSRTLAENMADHYGVRAAYRAFKKAVKFNGAELQPEDPQLGRYSQDQLFFMHFARSWCKKDAPIPAELADSHSPREHRILGTLRNFPAFQEAFACSAKTPMVSRRQCELRENQNEMLIMLFCLFVFVVCYLSVKKIYAIYCNRQPEPAKHVI